MHVDGRFYVRDKAFLHVYHVNAEILDLFAEGVHLLAESFHALHVPLMHDLDDLEKGIPPLIMVFLHGRNLRIAVSLVRCDGLDVGFNLARTDDVAVFHEGSFSFPVYGLRPK